MKRQSVAGLFVALIMVLGGCDGGASKKSIPGGNPAEILAYWVGKWEFKGQDVVSGKAPQQQVGSVVYRWKEKGKSIEGAGTVKYGDGPETPQNSDVEFDPALGVFIWRWREGGGERIIHRRYDSATGIYHDKGVSGGAAPGVKEEASMQIKGPDSATWSLAVYADGELKFSSKGEMRRLK